MGLQANLFCTTQDALKVGVQAVVILLQEAISVVGDLSREMLHDEAFVGRKAACMRHLDQSKANHSSGLRCG